ncbi:MAG: amidohydrolase family protein [Candidatus Bathyarchaeia archaeon]
MKSRLGIEVVDAHAHFMTAGSIKAWSLRGRTMTSFQQRTQTRTDIKNIEIPDENFDAAQRWADELDRYGVSSAGFMIGPETYDEFMEARRRFPGYFLGYLNIQPDDSEATKKIKKAADDGFYGIKLYPSNWRGIHVYDERLYPIYEEVLKHKMLVICHFGVSIGGDADLRSGNPMDIQTPARDFPELNFMIAHFGAGWFREVLLLQYQTDNVYMDSSGSNVWMKYLPQDLTLKDIFRHAIRAGGPNKILFGTDSTFFPRGFRYNILEEQYNAIQSLKRDGLINDEGIQNIFCGNHKRLTGYRPRK